MKLIIRLVVVTTILILITIHHTYHNPVTPVATTKYPSVRVKDTNVSTDLFSPSDIILVKLP